MMYDMLMGEEDASSNWDPEMNWWGHICFFFINPFICFQVRSNGNWLRPQQGTVHGAFLETPQSCIFREGSPGISWEMKLCLEGESGNDTGWHYMTWRYIQVDMVTCEGSYCGALGWIHGRHTGYHHNLIMIIITMISDVGYWRLLWCWWLCLTGPWLGEEATGVDVRIRYLDIMYYVLRICSSPRQQISRKQLKYFYQNIIFSKTRFGFHYRVDLKAGIVREGWVINICQVNSKCMAKCHFILKVRKWKWLDVWAIITNHNWLLDVGK